MKSRMFGRGHTRESGLDGRFRFIFICFVLAGTLIIGKLGYMQLYENGFYAMLASDQHDVQKKLLPTRGQIFARDRVYGTLYPLATNRMSWQVYAVPRSIKDKPATAKIISETLGLSYDEVLSKFTKREDDPYELLVKDANPDAVSALKSLNVAGIGFVSQTARLYPEKNISGQLIGFVTADESTGVPKGRYGIEGAMDELLTGKAGSLSVEKDATGQRLTIGDTQLHEAVHGSDVILTIDRTIQFKACSVIAAAVDRYRADTGSIVIINPQTGAVLSMCSAPDFDSSSFNVVKEISTYSNKATLVAYEPGSIFKPIVMASAIDAEKVSPNTTYIDKGIEEIDDFKIRNSDLQAHGAQNMVQVLEKSLNTGMIFVQRQMGKELFKRYIQNFGFGTKTDVGLTPEVKGNISSLEKKGNIFAATASYGQGITMTPIQLAAAYGALASSGALMRPYVVDEIVHPDGTREKTKPYVVSRPISSRASRLITGMLINVVENGHGKRAAVPGYWVAGKTGTAQVARSDGGLGYQKDVTIGSFAGYAPANDPKFAMIVKIEHPRDVQWAEATAAPVFGEMAAFLLTYLQVPPERPILKGNLPPKITPSATSTTATSSLRI